MPAQGRLVSLSATALVAPLFALVGGPAQAADKDWAPADSAVARALAGGDVAEPGTLQGGRITKQGWWARSNEPPPETGLLAPPSVPALAAPKGTLPVAQVAGEPERIAALEISLDGESDATVKSVVLALRESADPTANPNAAAAGVVVCAVTESYWIGAENGPWATRPEFDCSAGAVPGTRDDKGVWQFDLTSLASDWLAGETGLPPAVVLVSTAAAEDGAEADPASSSYQVAFDAAQGIGLLARTTPADQDENEQDADTDGAADTSDSDDGASVGGGSGGSGGALGGVGDIGGGAPIGGGSAPEPGDASIPTDASGGGDQAETTAVAPMAAPPALPWHAGIGRGMWLLLPVVLLLAYLCMLALGPAGQPAAGGGRRGVSRALDRLRTASPAFAHGRGRS